MNNSDCALIRRAVIESRIIKWFNSNHKKKVAPSKLLSSLVQPKNGMGFKLIREERSEFIKLIRRIQRTRKIITFYKKKYSRRPKFFYRKVFGFPPRKGQSVRIIWGALNIHFLFNKNDLMAFWRKVGWGPGSGCHLAVGDRDVKIKELRGLVSLGRDEFYSKETSDIIRHESVHAFEDFVKRRKSPSNRKRAMFYKIKSEMNAYLKNFKHTKNRKQGEINQRARLGIGLEVSEIILENVGYGREKTRKKYLSLYRKTVNQVKKALKVMPVGVLQRIIYEVPFKRLHKKIPETVKVYRKMRYKWYKQKDI